MKPRKIPCCVFLLPILGGAVLSLPDPACRPPAFSIVPTDREPGTD